jgi:5-oxoprolinase (ATP-hydrolysing) subunit A
VFKVDLNCDLGESFGCYKLGMDEQVIPYISSANIACGFHAADPMVMYKTVGLAKENQVHVGAHPGFPDLVGFGRRNMDISPAEVKRIIQYQIGALDAFCKVHHVPLRHVKPHGALYNMASKDKKMALAIVQGIFEYDRSLILLALSNSLMIEAAKEANLPYACEVFADRAYEEDGTLVARGKAGAFITNEDEAVARVIHMVKKHKVTTVTGRDIAIDADSVCVHGDGENALAFVKKIKAAFVESGIEICAL